MESNLMSVKNGCVAAFALAPALCFSIACADDQGADKSKELQTIVVTASPINQDRNYLATLVGSVDRSEILQSGGANLADALANEPGVTGTRAPPRNARRLNRLALDRGPE
jgi:iron complex outermembrane receptor protein